MKKLIYVLACPFTKEVHYVGKSTSGMLRPSTHLKKSHSDKIKEWVKELKILGQKPDIKVECYVSEQENIDTIERLVIIKYLNKGSHLLNSNLITPATILPPLDECDPEGLKVIAEFVKARRKKIDMTQAEFSKKCGVGIRFIRELEQGQKDNFQTKSINQVLAMFGYKISIDKVQKNP
tara:strand:- start:11909 stop:12445 length:537 start_codon:yes stop_codon:yes gene_type:complete